MTIKLHRLFLRCSALFGSLLAPSRMLRVVDRTRATRRQKPTHEILHLGEKNGAAARVFAVRTHRPSKLHKK